MKANILAGMAMIGWSVLLLPAAGCGDARSGPTREAAPSATAKSAEADFDASTCGIVQGRVTWKGDAPRVPDFEVLPNQLGGAVFHQKQTRANPNAPVINSADQGVSGAVVFLRGVDPTQSKHWNHSPVTVEQRDCRIHVTQDNTDSRSGFVRRGDRIKMVSRDRLFCKLTADGADFFSFAFPDPDQPLERTLDQKGIVELTSGSGYFWARAYLFVDDHPYYTRTDEHGRFKFAEVPPGYHEVVCWMPSWIEAGHHRDPESRLISRMFFQPPMEKVQSASIGRTGVAELQMVVSLRDFHIR